MPTENLTDKQVQQMKELGEMFAPLLTVWVATQLAAARFQADPTGASSREVRGRIIGESAHEANALLKALI